MAEINYKELSSLLGVEITPENVYGSIGKNTPIWRDKSLEGFGLSGYDGQDQYMSNSPYSQYFQLGGMMTDPKTGQPIMRMYDTSGGNYLGQSDLLDPNAVQYDPNIGVYTSYENITPVDDQSFLNKLGEGITLAGIGAIAGGAAGLYGAGAGGVAEAGGVAAGTEGATAYPLLSTGLAPGAAAPVGTALGATELAGLGGTALATGGGGSSAAASTGLLGTGITPSMALKGAGLVGSLVGGGSNTGGTGGGDTGGQFDLGGMLTGGANLAYQNQIGNQAVQEARDLAPSMQFTPYSISSGMGRTYVDPATGEMKSELAPEWQGAQNELMDSFYGNMQQATMDPMEASQYAYNMGSQLNAYQDEQNRLGLENRLLSQGMLGSTGGGTQMRALYDANNQRDLGREAQSLTLGQNMLNQYQQRALNAYQPAWNTQTQFANQVGQSGTLGGQAMQGNTNAANLINQANLGRMKMNSTAASSFANNPSLAGGINNLWSNAGNMLSGAGNWFTGGGGEDQYNQLLNQQGDFNWSGVPDVVAGSDQDMQLYDQWNWGD